MKTLFLVFAISIVLSQLTMASANLVYRETPQEVWREHFNAIGPGNGAFLSPDGDILVVVADNGRIRAFEPYTGAAIWTFTPEFDDDDIVPRCNTGLNFVQTSSSKYIAYAVVAGDHGAVNTTSRILAVSLTGTLMFESVALAGSAAGAPKFDRLGRYLVLTHNDEQHGFFSVLDTEQLSPDPSDPTGSMPLLPVYQYESELEVYNETTPFSDVGFFHNPQQGFYASPNHNGLNNNNDLFIWMTDTNTMVQQNGNPRAGQGQMYVFQFPQDYNHSGEGLEVIPIGPSTRPYQARTRPTITNNGKTLYWAMVRGELRSWANNQFSRADTAKVDLGRGSPPYLPPLAPPTLGKNDAETPDVYGIGSSNLVWRASDNLVNLTTFTTDGLLSNTVVVAGDDSVVLFGTHTGTLYCAQSDDLSTVWQVGDDSTIELSSIQGEMALDGAGAMLFVTTNENDVAGQVVAIRIADEPNAPSISPSATPSSRPSSAPSHAPSGIPSAQPASPSSSPSYEPTLIEKLSTPTLPPITGSPTKDHERIEDKKMNSASGHLAPSPLLAFFMLTLCVVFTNLMG